MLSKGVVCVLLGGAVEPGGFIYSCLAYVSAGLRQMCARKRLNNHMS